MAGTSETVYRRRPCRQTVFREPGALCGLVRRRKMDDTRILKNRLKEVRTERKQSQSQLADMAGVSRNTIRSIETGQFSPTAKPALILCIALDKKFEELFYFDQRAGHGFFP